MIDIQVLIILKYFGDLDFECYLERDREGERIFILFYFLNGDFGICIYIYIYFF